MLFKELVNKTEKIIIVGMGYVGLPLAIELSKKYAVIGFDIDENKINALQKGIDKTGEIPASTLKSVPLTFSNKPNTISQGKIIIVTVPTPINDSNIPDLSPITSATKMIGTHLQKGAVVIYESTVYPGLTEEICVPLLENTSGLTYLTEFKVGYSPERLSPGDDNHTLTKIVKVVSGCDKDTLELVSNLYSSIIPAGIHKAPSIKVAEAAKVIENTQRDLNVALMNELSIIFSRMGINTLDVVNAAATKWNFMRMTPGLVGGHCIGVDPYYLTYKAEKLGYIPEVILSGRRINDGMGKYIANQTIKKLITSDIRVKGSTILILGITFKENVSDIRNSKVPDIITELQEYGINVIVTDPLADPKDTKHEYGISLSNYNDVSDVDAIILAVNHDAYKKFALTDLNKKFTKSPTKKVLIDIKGVYLEKKDIISNFEYWTL